MNGLKIGAIVLGLLLLVTIGFAAMVQMNNMKLNEDKSSLENDLTATNAKLDSTQTTLQGTEQELNTSQLFILTYIKALGAHNYAWEADNASLSKWSLAVDYYVNDSYDNAIRYYTEAKNGYENASQEWMTAGLLYKEVGTYTINTTYQNYFNLYYSMVMEYSNSTEHYSNYMNYMAIACGYYKNGDYTTGNNNYDKGSVEYDRGLEEQNKGTAYKTEADNLLTALYSK